jgi:hypothetical protein
VGPSREGEFIRDDNEERRKGRALDVPERKALTRLVAWVTISARGYLTERRICGVNPCPVIQMEYTSGGTKNDM